MVEGLSLPTKLASCTDNREDFAPGVCFCCRSQAAWLREFIGSGTLLPVHVQHHRQCRLCLGEGGRVVSYQLAQPTATNGGGALVCSSAGVAAGDKVGSALHFERRAGGGRYQGCGGNSGGLCSQANLSSSIPYSCRQIGAIFSPSHPLLPPPSGHSLFL